jgi:hypothetical protein
MNVPAVRTPLTELCPPRDILVSYARGGRDPGVAGHISRCDRCAWIVTEAMEADPTLRDADVIDITPHEKWWRRLFRFVRRLRNSVH